MVNSQYDDNQQVEKLNEDLRIKKEKLAEEIKRLE